jgi:hypothetical protein
MAKRGVGFFHYYELVLRHVWRDLEGRTVASMIALVGIVVVAVLLQRHQIVPSNQTWTRAFINATPCIGVLVTYLLYATVRAPWKIYSEKEAEVYDKETKLGEMNVTLMQISSRGAIVDASTLQLGLTVKETAVLSIELSRYPGQAVSIVVYDYPGSTGKAAGFAAELYNIFSWANWLVDVKSEGVMPFGAIHASITVTVKDTSNQPPEAAALIEAFNRAGIMIGLQAMHTSRITDRIRLEIF